MVIIVDIRTDRRIVIVPFSLRDFEVSVGVSERLQELVEHLVLGHLPGFDLGVLGGVVDPHEVLGSDEPVAVLVELQIGLVDYGLPSLVGLALERERGGGMLTLIPTRNSLKSTNPDPSLSRYFISIFASALVISHCYSSIP